MGVSNLFPTNQKVIDAATIATTTSYTFTAKMAGSYGLWIVASAVTGTSPTCDISLQHSPDGGTTWLIAPIRSVQITASNLTQYATFRLGMGESQAATQGATAATGGTLAANFVPSSMSWRLTATVGGTNPSFTLNAWLSSLPVGSRY